ncbi:MAG: hypothetical protein WAK17_18345 [Candidatus Nitrosopolaris sp.]
MLVLYYAQVIHKHIAGLLTSIDENNRSELDHVIGQVKQELRSLFAKSDKQIKKLGNALKKVVKKEESICEEIKIALKEEIAEGVISTRTIELHSLHEWKRKTKPKQRENEKISFSKQVEKKPQQQIAATQEGKSVIINETADSTTEASISKGAGTDDNSEAQVPQTKLVKSVSYEESTPCTKTDNIHDNSLLAVNKPPQNRSGKRIDECSNCSGLRIINQELEEALRKATTLSTADTLYSKTDTFSNEAFEVLNLEFSLSYQAVQQYVAAEFQRGKNKVWFSITINVKTKEVASVKTGRISELEAN